MNWSTKNYIFVLCLFTSSVMAEKINALQNILSELGDRIYCIAEQTGNSNNEIQEHMLQSTKQITKLFENNQIVPGEYLDEYYAAISLGNKKIVSIFLDAGFDPNIKNENGQTPLMTAALRGNVEAVEILLERGADPNVVDNDGRIAKDFTRRVQMLYKEGGWGALSALPIMVVAYAKYKNRNPFEKCEELIDNHGSAFGWLKTFTNSMMGYLSFLYSRFVAGCSKLFAYNKN